LTHWTGHPKRLERKTKNKFGDHAYAEEELIAELGAAFLSAEFGISCPEKADHASYIANWLKVLKDNKQFVISAASEASKAVEYMKELQPLRL
jgi:antirestriction protein ArdC